MSKWISADDKLPEKDKSVLVYYKLADGMKRCGIAHYCEGCFSREDVWILAKDIYACGFVLKNVLYWMPIPKLPEQENQNRRTIINKGLTDMPTNKTKLPNIDLTDDDFTCILTAAIRYTLGRETYMPMLVTDYIRPLLPYLSDKALWLFERDIREQGNSGYERAYGDPLIDKPTWNKFYADVVCEMEKRKDKGDE